MTGAALELPDRVLIVRLGAIGDVVNAQVVANAIREARPETTIGWVVHDLARPIVEGHPSVDRVHLWPRTSGLAGLRRVSRELRDADYGLAVNLQRIAKSGLLAARSGAGRILGFDRRRTRELSWIWSTDRIAPGRAGTHMVEWYLEFVEHLGLARPRVLHRFPTDAGADAWAEELVGELGAAPALVHLGASKPRKRWTPRSAGELAAGLVDELDTPVLLTGGPGDEHEVAPTLEAAGRAPTRVQSLVARTSLPQLVALARRARVFVGSDTGPMHIAAAVGTPVLALFGPGEPARTGPYGPGHRVLQSPTGRTADLSAARVLAAAVDLVGAARARG